MMTVVDDASEVYRLHADELVRYATALVGPAAAPDVVVDSVLAAVGSAGWANVENRRAYLFRVVLNRCSSVRRSDARRALRELRVGVAAAPEATPVDASIDARRLLAGLSPQQRAVVYFTYWDDLTPVQVGALLGVSEGTVRKQLARAREHLRRVLR